MVAAENGVFEFQGVEQPVHFLEQAVFVQRLELSPETLLIAIHSCGKADDQCRQVLRLCFVHQARRVQGMLLAVTGAAQAIENHDGTPGAGGFNLL